MADVFDRGRKEKEFNVGDQMYLSTKNLDTVYTGFLNSCKLGPSGRTILRLHKHAYELNLSPGLKLRHVFNPGSLKPYKQPARLSRPQAVIFHDGTVGQIVEVVLKKRQRKGNTQYLIRWVGEVKATWEPLEDLHPVTGLIKAFEAK
ncbi:hypothetical protein PHMEG_00033699 [Phytophthora megakarya]|uniref:Chromo domain-containing protein n=1 Tax=Phytophthora megakarya TaxID=4795 RepID=A0A225UV80_9STRA|nr:hypothetical protein PHMEG_00033699 [Phytophthora megakarya]